MLIKIVLHLFVGNVDAELLKRIGLKVFKAKNVQQTYGQRIAAKERFSFWEVLGKVEYLLDHSAGRQEYVYLINDPVKQSAINRLGHGIASSLCLLY